VVAGARVITRVAHFPWPPAVVRDQRPQVAVVGGVDVGDVTCLELDPVAASGGECGRLVVELGGEPAAWQHGADADPQPLRFHAAFVALGLGKLEYELDGVAWLQARDLVRLGHLEGCRVLGVTPETVSERVADVSHGCSPPGCWGYPACLGAGVPGCLVRAVCDDVVVHCASEQRARQIRDAIAARLAEVGLELHPQKTRIVYCKDDDRRGDHEATSFVFLGYEFERVESSV